MNITIFGTGYVGLVQAVVMAEVGHHVICVDVDANRIEQLKQGIVPLFEPGLAPLLQSNLQAGRIEFTTDPVNAVKKNTFQLIAVGTPPDEDGSADLQYVLAVSRTIAEHMDKDKIIIIKSTVPVGTADKVELSIRETLNNRQVGINFDVVSNPEFLKEGAAVSDCLKPDRIIIGTTNSSVQKKMKLLYAPFNRNRDRVIYMDNRSAELTKYAANCMLATKISFMNEMSNLAEILGADIEDVRQGIGSDPRIGYQYIYPGCGYGGSCFPKDVKAIIRTAREYHFTPSLLESVEKVNDRQKHRLFDFLSGYFKGDLSGKVFAVWGLSFKPNTDDMREAPSRVLLEALWQAGAKTQAFDPKAMPECQRIYPDEQGLKLVESKELALENADALIICTEWQQFRAPDFQLIWDKLSHPLIIDGRNLYLPELVKQLGFHYYGIGRGDSLHRRAEDKL